ncbi:FecR family protein [Niastella yeongjuensis]|nr:FecR family protein [Niastella yeongjuensis]
MEDKYESFMNASPAEQEKMFAEHKATSPRDKFDLYPDWESINKKFATSSRPPMNLYSMMAAAAMIGILLALAYLFFTGHKLKEPTQGIARAKGPELILSNGSVIDLDNIPNGAFTAKGIHYTKTDTSLMCRLLEPYQVAIPDTHKLTVPSGRRYQVTLADGSIILLNASSQLHFPVQFSTNERWVYMQGEAFFKVNADRVKPFFVNVNNEVYTIATGTAFNIRAYEGTEHIKATLIEGHLSVKVYRSSKSTTLQAGQQVNYKDGKFVSPDHLDLNQVIAWKKDIFHFNNSSIDEIMEEIGRWYNVKIQYEGKKPCTYLYAVLDRSMSLEAIIETMSLIQVHLRLEGDTLIVSSL